MESSTGGTNAPREVPKTVRTPPKASEGTEAKASEIIAAVDFSPAEIELLTEEIEIPNIDLGEYDIELSEIDTQIDIPDIEDPELSALLNFSDMF